MKGMWLMEMLARQTTSNRRCCNHGRSQRAGVLQRKSRLELDCQGGNLTQPRMQLKHLARRLVTRQPHFRDHRLADYHNLSRSWTHKAPLTCDSATRLCHHLNFVGSVQSWHSTTSRVRVVGRGVLSQAFAHHRGPRQCRTGCSPVRTAPQTAAPTHPGTRFSVITIVIIAVLFPAEQKTAR